MSKPTYYETSFRFKWGIGFIIEMITEGLKEVAPSSPVSYALENQVYVYEPKEKEFVESEENIDGSTATNFVLKMDRTLFEDILKAIGTSNDHLKPQLITEFKERPKTDEEQRRLDSLHETYDDMEFIDTILSYTALQMTFPDDKTIVIEDPQPQEQNEDFQIV